MFANPRTGRPYHQEEIQKRYIRKAGIAANIGAEQVALGYSGQQEIERVFRGLKDGDWLGWGPIVWSKNQVTR
jgi:hypothetical protein